MSETRTNEQEAAAYQAGEREALDRLWSNNQGIIKSRCFIYMLPRLFCENLSKIYAEIEN